MANLFEPEYELAKVKKRILSLDALKSDASELEFLILNALEIMSNKGIDTSDLSHTFYNKEMYNLINGTVNEERIENFKKVQQWCKSQISSEHFEIDTIPDEWTYQKVERLY